jgi:hypothetical protein
VSGTDNWTTTDVSIDYSGITALDATETDIHGLTFNGTVWVCSVFVNPNKANRNYPQFLYSSNGKSWTASKSYPFPKGATGSTGATEGIGAYNIAWNEHMLVATGTSVASSGVSIAYSTDNGVTWTAVANSRANIIRIGRGIAWNGKAWLLTGTPTASLATSSIAYSLNGVSWTPVSGTTPYTGPEGYSVATDGKRWVVGGTNIRPAYTTDLTGTSGWTTSTWNIPDPSNPPSYQLDPLNSTIRDIGWNGRQWLLIADNLTPSGPVIATSDNNIDVWTTRLTQQGATGANMVLRSLNWNSVGWIVTGLSTDDNEKLLSSVDNGVTWLPPTPSTTRQATSITSRTNVGSFYDVIPYINVRDFGAIGDGITSDNNAINSALSYARKYTNGVRVVVPAGTYLYGTDLSVQDNIEFVQETGAKLTLNTAGTPISISSDLGSIRSRIIKNDDETNALSSYNGVVMNGTYATGGGLGNDATRSVANMFDIKSDRRQIGNPIDIKIANTTVTGGTGFNITTTGNTLPAVKVGNAITFDSNNGSIVANTIYYIVTVTTSGTNATITISSIQSLASTFSVGTLTSSSPPLPTGKAYDSTGVFGSTLTGRTILDAAEVPIGGRVGVEGRVEQTRATSISNLNKNYIGVGGFSSTTSGDTGTNLAGGARGNYFGGRFGASLTGTATNVERVVGAQFDATVAGATATSKYIFGASSVSSFAGALNAATKAAAYQIGAVGGTTGWLHGILFSNANGENPLGATGTILGSDLTGTSTITNGINLSGFEMTGNVLASPRLQIKDAPSGTPTITTTTGRNISFEAGGTGVATLKSGSGSVNIGVGSSNTVTVTASDTTLTGNLYAKTIKSASGGDHTLQLQSAGTGNVDIKSLGTGKVLLGSDTEVAANKKLTVFSSLGLGTSVGSRLTLKNTANEDTAYVSGKLDCQGDITASGTITANAFAFGGTGMNINTSINTGTNNITTEGIVYTKTVTASATGDNNLNLNSAGTGSVLINSPSGNVELRRGGTAVVTAGASGVTLAQPLDMSNRNITNAATVGATLFSGPVTGTLNGNINKTAASALSLQSASGQNVTLNPGGGTAVVTAGPSGVTLAQPLAMGGNAISGATTIGASSTVTANLFSGPVTGTLNGNITKTAASALSLQSASGQNVTLNPGGGLAVTVGSSGVTLAQPLAMGGNAISGASAITASGAVTAGSLSLGGGTNVTSAINTGGNNITTTGAVTAGSLSLGGGTNVTSAINTGGNNITTTGTVSANTITATNANITVSRPLAMGSNDISGASTITAVTLNATGSLILGGSYINIDSNINGTQTPILTRYAGNLRFYRDPPANATIPANGTIYYLFRHGEMNSYDILNVQLRDGSGGHVLTGNIVLTVHYTFAIPIGFRIYLRNMTSSDISFNEVQISYAITQVTIN